MLLASLDVSEATVSADKAVDAARMMESAEHTIAFLKSLANPIRLILLCRLAEGNARVGELEDALGVPQSQISKQLARLREEGMVRAHRDGRSVVYSLEDERARRIVRTLYEEFCVME